MGILIIFLVLFSLSSCATMIHGKNQEVVVVSDPPGAQVLCDGEKIGTTPLVVTVPRKHDYTITVLKNGFHSYDVPLKRRLAATSLLYALPGGAVMLGIDSIHGAQFEFERELKIRLWPLFQLRGIMEQHMKVLKSITQSISKRYSVTHSKAQYRKSASNLEG